MSEKEYETVADDTGKWLVKMEPLSAGGPYTLSVSCGGQKEVFKNVMIGEVWLASGAVEYELQGWCCLVCR